MHGQCCLYIVGFSLFYVRGSGGLLLSVMPKAVFDQLNYTKLTPTPMQLQQADSSIRHPEEIAEDVPVRVRDYFVPIDFVVLDMDN